MVTKCKTYNYKKAIVVVFFFLFFLIFFICIRATPSVFKIIGQNIIMAKSHSQNILFRFQHIVSVLGQRGIFDHISRVES